MKINYRLLPIKLHYFSFMAACGPILPYLTVYGKQLGISEVVMGSITAVLPVFFLLAKPFFGYLADFFIHQRKLIFMLIILSMSLFNMSLYFIPPLPHYGERTVFFHSSELRKRNLSNRDHEESITLNCTTSSADSNTECYFTAKIFSSTHDKYFLEGSESCIMNNSNPVKCVFAEDSFAFYRSFAFYGFVIFMSLSMTAYNVANSISDAICFDVLGDDGKNSYGKQRVWGAVGFGITALISGFGMDFYSEDNTKNYNPAFIMVLIFTFMDLFCCTKLKLPKMTQSKSILKDMWSLFKHKRIIVFLGFTVLAGILDSFIIYFLFWFLEDLALETQQTKSIKLLEGLTVAAETLGSEILFFPISGKILDKIGYNLSFTLCFFNYALRLGLISLITNPWWILSIELFMQGPTYALMYTAIVAYANAVAPPGTSATMQGLVAGMDDGLGYAAGSLVGGFLYKAAGGRLAFQCYCLLSLLCCVTHFGIHKLFFSQNDSNSKDVYNTPVAQEIKASDDETTKL